MASLGKGWKGRTILLSAYLTQNNKLPLTIRLVTPLPQAWLMINSFLHIYSFFDPENPKSLDVRLKDKIPGIILTFIFLKYLFDNY